MGVLNILGLKSRTQNQESQQKHPFNWLKSENKQRPLKTHTQTRDRGDFEQNKNSKFFSKKLVSTKW